MRQVRGKRGHVDDMVLRPIGVIESAFDRPTSMDEMVRHDSRLIVDREWMKGLGGLSPGDQVLVVYWFHMARGHPLQQHPKGDESRPKRGVFALCTPRRPNRIGTTVVELLEIDGNVLQVRGLDAVNRSPLLDIKPWGLPKRVIP